MANNDYNIIKPLEGLQNIGSLTPLQQRKEKKHKKNSQKQNLQEQPEKSVEQNINDNITEDGSDEHKIDYRA